MASPNTPRRVPLDPKVVRRMAVSIGFVVAIFVGAAVIGLWLLHSLPTGLPPAGQGGVSNLHTPTQVSSR